MNQILGNNNFPHWIIREPSGVSVLESESCPNVSKHWRGTKMSVSAPWHLRSFVRSSEEEIWNQTTFAQFRIGKYPLYRWRCMIIFRKIWSTLTNGTLIIIPWCALKKICSDWKRRRRRIKEKKHAKCICFLLSSVTFNLSHRVSRIQ